jgi:hypothetical protein
VLNIVPVVEVSLLIQLLIGPDLLDMDLTLDDSPALGIPLHERVAITWDLSHCGCDLISRLEPALEKGLGVLTTILRTAVGKNTVCELDARRHSSVRRRHFTRG